MYDYLDAMITRQTSPQEAFRKFDVMSEALSDKLRRTTKMVCMVSCWAGEKSKRGRCVCSGVYIHMYFVCMGGPMCIGLYVCVCV